MVTQAQYAALTEEEKEKYRLAARINWAKKWAAMSEEEREEYKQNRRPKEKERMRKLRAARTVQQHALENEKAREHMGSLYKNMPPEEKEKFLAMLALKRRTNETYRINVMYHQAKKRAKLKGLEFTLIKSDILIPEFCPVLGIKLTPGDRDNFDASPSIDRIDNTKGYTRENIAIISYRANNIKNNGTAEEHVKIAEWMKRVGAP